MTMLVSMQQEDYSEVIQLVNMRKQIFILGILAILILIPLVNAVADSDISNNFKQGQRIDYRKPCIDNGTYCQSSARCNLTVQYQNGSLFVDNKAMTNKKAYHNYSLPVTYVLGIYRADITCCDGANCGSETYHYQITPTGDKTQSSLIWIFLVAIFGIIVFGFWREDLNIITFGAFALMPLGIWIISNGVDIYKNWVTNSFGTIMLGIGFYIGARAVLELLENNY